jgi:drug/metabolite transporter (DMT)-like permease
MYLTFALASAFATAFGTFLTRSLISKLPTYQIVGPLFIMNGLAATPLIVFRSDWVQLNFVELWQMILLGVMTALGAVFVFVIIERSSASLSIVGASLSPALVLFLSPLLLHSHTPFAQFIIVGVLILAALYPIRNLVLGIHSAATILMMLAQGINAGLIAILISRLAKDGVGLSQFLFVQQMIAGLCFLLVFWPKDVSLKSYPLLARRSVFMSLGWFFLMVAINRGSTLVVQSILSVTPLIIVLIEAVVFRKKPSISIILSALTIVACISVLSFT